MSAADTPPPDEALAIDFAIGALDRETLAQVELRQAQDPVFAALCAQWAERLAPLNDEVPPSPPSADLYARIERSLFPAADTRPLLSGLWESLSFWRLSTALSSAVALLVLLAWPRGSEPPAPPVPARFAAALAGETRVPIATVAIDADGSAIIVPTGASGGGATVPELWLIPADGQPRSLGVLRPGGAQRIKVPANILALVADGATLAVSLEPVGGSPTGLPTGPVVASGQLGRV